MTTETFTCGCSLEDGQFARLCGLHATITVAKKIEEVVCEAVMGGRDAFPDIAGILDPYLLSALRSKRGIKPGLN